MKLMISFSGREDGNCDRMLIFRKGTWRAVCGLVLTVGAVIMRKR